MPPAEIDPARPQRLLAIATANVKARAEAVFAHQAKPRKAVVDAYRPALAQGDPSGRRGGLPEGLRIVPSPGRRGDRGRPRPGRADRQVARSLLVAILDPNRAFEAKYTSFNVATADGRVLTGMIASETATSVTLRRQEGKEDVLLRGDIEAMAGSGQSLMPEGLEKDLTPQRPRRPDRLLEDKRSDSESIAGNLPSGRSPGPDGHSLTIVYLDGRGRDLGVPVASRHGNLGFWMCQERPSCLAERRAPAATASGSTGPATTAPPATRSSWLRRKRKRTRNQSLRHRELGASRKQAIGEISLDGGRAAASSATDLPGDDRVAIRGERPRPRSVELRPNMQRRRTMPKPTDVRPIGTTSTSCRSRRGCR